MPALPSICCGGALPSVPCRVSSYGLAAAFALQPNTSQQYNRPINCCKAQKPPLLPPSLHAVLPLPACSLMK